MAAWINKPSNSRKQWTQQFNPSCLYVHFKIGKNNNIKKEWKKECKYNLLSLNRGERVWILTNTRFDQCWMKQTFWNHLHLYCIFLLLLLTAYHFPCYHSSCCFIFKCHKTCMELTHLLIEKHTSSHLKWEASVKCNRRHHCNSFSTLETNHLSNVDDGSMFHVLFFSQLLEMPIKLAEVC